MGVTRTSALRNCHVCQWRSSHSCLSAELSACKFGNLALHHDENINSSVIERRLGDFRLLDHWSLSLRRHGHDCHSIRILSGESTIFRSVWMVGTWCWINCDIDGPLGVLGLWGLRGLLRFWVVSTCRVSLLSARSSGCSAPVSAWSWAFSGRCGSELRLRHLQDHATEPAVV